MSYKCSASVKISYVWSLMTEGFRDQMEISRKVSQNGKSAPSALPLEFDMFALC